MSTRVHEVTFERVEDAAAFMAAVSRQAAGPRVVRGLRVEVELLSPGARVYMDDIALLLAELAFGPIPRVSLDRASLDHTARRVSVDLYQHTDTEEILQRLSAHLHILPDHEVA
jgi:hypothetical protein